MSGEYLGAVEGWVVTRDGETIAGPFGHENEPFEWLQRYQSQSWDWAIRHEGYDVVHVENGQVTWSYRRDQLDATQEGAELGAIELIELGDSDPDDEYDIEYELGAKVAKRITLERAKRIAERVDRQLRPLSDKLIIAGSVRRRRPEIGDIEFVMLPRHAEWSSDIESVAKALEKKGYDVGPKVRKAVKYLNGVKIEIYIAHDLMEMGSMLFMYTGDQQFNIAMRRKAKSMGYLLNQYGIFTRDPGKQRRTVLESPDERAFFEFLKVPYHTPRERSVKHRTSAERKKAKKRQGPSMNGTGALDGEDDFFTRLESIWGEPLGDDR